MAYKFQRGPATASGSFQAEEGLVSSTTVEAKGGNISGSAALQIGTSATIGNGLTVTTGTSALQAVTATTVSGTTSQFTILSASNLGGAAVSAVSMSFLPSWDSGLGRFENSFVSRNGLSGQTIVSGSGGLVVTGSVSGSGAFQGGSTATFANTVTVSAGGLIVSSGDSSVQKLTVNGDLIVLGDTFSASVGTLLIQDAAIVIGDGRTSFDINYGILFGSGSGAGSGSGCWATLLTAQANIDGLVNDENVLSSSLAIKAPAFAGTLYGTLSTAVQLVSDGITLNNGVNFFNDLSANATVTLPPTPTAGDTVQVKCRNLTNAQVTINRSGVNIDGEGFIILESPYAAVTLIYVGSNDWRVF